MTAQLFDFPTPIQPKKAKPRKPISYSEEFETKIWQPYPRKTNCSKLEAFKAFDRLPEESQAQAMAAMPIFVRSCRGKDEAYIPHCATWINQRRFETVTAPVATHPMQPSSTTPDWVSIMKMYAITSNWKQDNGPPPGYPGCRVPAEYLSEMS